MLPTKEQDKSPEEEISGEEIDKLPDKQFKVMIIRSFHELGRIMDIITQNFNKELKNIKKNQTELKHTITDI